MKTLRSLGRSDCALALQSVSRIEKLRVSEKRKRRNMTMESSIDVLFSAKRSSSSASAVRLLTSDGHSSKIWFST